MSDRTIIRRLVRRPELAWLLFVIATYVVATRLVTSSVGPGIDRMMLLATRLAEGHVDVPTLAGQFDTVEVAGRTYLAFSLMPVVPYLAFLPFPQLWPYAKDIVPATLGIVTALVALPFARRYTTSSSSAAWLTVLIGFGTLLPYCAVSGNFYYLAHVQSALACLLLLIEWRGQKRPIVLGATIAAAFLARPTLLAAAVPFGLAIMLCTDRSIGRSVGFVAPIALAIAASGAYNAVRFGSFLDSGYATSLIVDELEARRAMGVFSLAHIPYNVYLAVFHGFEWRAGAPYIVADLNGHSLLLTTPALLIALNGPYRTSLARLLAAAALLVAAPVFVYYGGGVQQFGYRYAMDFMPFVLALVGLGLGTRPTGLDRGLILLSVAFVSYGILLATGWPKAI